MNPGEVQWGIFKETYKDFNSFIHIVLRKRQEFRAVL